MQSQLHIAEQALDRLSQLGIPSSALTESVWQGYLARTRMTANHPKVAHGIVMWAETVAVLRDQLRPDGWIKSDKGNYELTVNPTQDLAIVVMTGDDATGRGNATPSNKCSKGASTEDVIEINSQLDMFGEALIVSEKTQEQAITWVLLFHVAMNEVRCELSLPLNMSDGKINDWKERIILPVMSLDDDRIEINLPDLPDIDIAIKKKA